MKNFSYILAVLLFIAVLSLRCGFTTISKDKAAEEKLIVKFADGEAPLVHEIKFDKNSGAYAYMVFDSAKGSSYLVTRSGKSGFYTGINSESSFFDKQGNIYSFAYTLENESSSKSFLLKNSEILVSFENINDNWAEKDGRLFFTAKENGKTFLAALELQSGTISKGKGYDDIILALFPNYTDEDENPVGVPGFTKEGKPYYIAVEKGKNFLVVGETEQKPYAFIDPYSVTFDKTGNPAYFANDKGGESDINAYGNYFLVQGTKEFQKFNYTYGPILFDKNNSPLYGAEVKGSKKDEVSSRLYSGEQNISSKYSGGASYPCISPQGQIAFVGYFTDNDGGIKCCLVTDGKEGKRYDAISNLTYNTSGVPMYIASLQGRQFIIKGEERIASDTSDILDYRILKNGKLYYAVFEHGDYNTSKPDKYFIVINSQRFGPYENLRVGEGEPGRDFITDEAGNFATISYKFIDTKSYLYEYKVITNKGESEKFDEVRSVKFTGGKMYFPGTKIVDQVNYTRKTKIYCDFQPVTPEYDFISELNDDAGSGSINFYAIRNGEAYQVELKN